jgi:uncharacterized protein with FMN-binding domain
MLAASNLVVHGDNMKKLTVAVVCLAALVLCGCTSAEVKAVRSLPINHVDLSLVKDGVYSGDYSYSGFTYQVEVTVADHHIKDVAIINNRKTNRATMAAGVAQSVVDQQKNDVDAVSGATTTSKALLKAIENALSKGL